MGPAKGSHGLALTRAVPSAPSVDGAVGKAFAVDHLQRFLPKWGHLDSR